jgi:hypothetical protein
MERVMRSSLSNMVRGAAVLTVLATGYGAASGESADLLVGLPEDLQIAVRELLEATSGDRPGRGLVSSMPPMRQAGWTLHHADREPSVEAEDRKGYRIVLLRTWQEHPQELMQQQQAVPSAIDSNRPGGITRHEAWHFVLFPVAVVSDNSRAQIERLESQGRREEAARVVGVTPAAKWEIMWQVPDADTYRLPVALGEGHGFRWFTYAGIPTQYFVRDKLKLTGGDDQLALMVRGLTVNDKGTGTRNGVMGLFVEFGDQGFEALDKLVRNSDRSWNEHGCLALRAMGGFRDTRATTRLMEVYHESPIRELRQSAAYVLISQPFRTEAKEAYFSMLRRGDRASEALQACEEFNWRDAAPLVARLVEKPRNLGVFRQAIQTYRRLAGKPIEADLLEAAATIRQQDPSQHDTAEQRETLASARAKIAGSADVEAAIYVALEMAFYGMKANNIQLVQDEGIACLQVLPRADVTRTLDQLYVGLDESYRHDLRRVRERLGLPASVAGVSASSEASMAEPQRPESEF